MEQAPVSPAALTTTKTPLPPIGEFFRLLWSQFRQRYALYLTIACIANAYAFIHPLVVLVVPANSGLGTGIELMLDMVNLVLSIWGSLALMAAVVFPEKTPTVGSAFRVGGPFFLNNLTTGLLYTLILAAGLILLIVPGIYWGVLYLLATYLVMREGISNGAALKRSKTLVTGHWFALFVRLLVYGVMILGGGMIIGFVFGFAFLGFPKELQTFLEAIVSGVAGVIVSALTVVLLNVTYQHVTAARKV